MTALPKLDIGATANPADFALVAAAEADLTAAPRCTRRTAR